MTDVKESATVVELPRRSTKSASAFRTISEVADELDVPQHVLRFWETKFPQIRPLKRGGGRRYYRPEDVELLRRISKLLYSEGYTIKGVQRLLREGQIKPGKALPDEQVLPLGLEELDPPVEELDPEPEPAPRRRRAVASEASPALLQDIHDELVELRELLARHKR